MTATPEQPLAVARTARFGMVYADVLLGSDLSPMARLVYAGLTVYAGGNGNAWPTATTLATELGLSRSATYKALDDLETAGVITRTRRATGAGADRPTLVTIHDHRTGGSVRHTDTSVRDTDGSVRQEDTRSVRQEDTNRRTENRTARAPAPAPAGQDVTRTAVPTATETGALIQDTNRRRGLRTDHAAGAARARAALAEAQQL